MHRTQIFQSRKNLSRSTNSRLFNFQFQKTPESVGIQSLISKMDPTHIFFKELEIDNDSTFTANFTKENEVDNIKEQTKVWQEIQDLVKTTKSQT